VLETSEDCRLLSRPGGYVLELDGEQLDAALFERLLKEGRDLLAGGETSSAGTRLREALALWRGPPLADVASLNFAQPEIRRLEELRVLALMERIDADLSLGHDDELVPEIQALVLSHPLGERLRAQLMLALYRSGRQAESLDVYRDASRMLREELGLEPGPALRALERMVLHHDDGLDGRRQAPRPGDRGAVVCPFKGLASFDVSDAEHFCGRECVVSDLVARLAEWTLVGILGRPAATRTARSSCGPHPPSSRRARISTPIRAPPPGSSEPAPSRGAI